MNKAVKQYEQAMQGLAKAFITRYYCDEEEEFKSMDWYWIADDIGGCLCVGDEHWNPDVMVTALKLNPASNILFEWYWEYVEGEGHPNLKNYLKMTPKE